MHSRSELSNLSLLLLPGVLSFLPFPPALPYVMESPPRDLFHGEGHKKGRRRKEGEEERENPILKVAPPHAYHHIFLPNFRAFFDQSIAHSRPLIFPKSHLLSQQMIPFSLPLALLSSAAAVITSFLPPFLKKGDFKKKSVERREGGEERD